MRTILFTDLDGTLLNHDDYSFEDAKEALKLLKDKEIPIIFTTSKTKIEVEEIQKKTGITDPFIIENGAAILFPKNYKNFNLSFLKDYKEYKIFQLGKTYAQILKFYNRYKDEFEMYGFNEMDIKEISKHTKLSEEASIFAKKRDFTEPFLLKNPSKLTNLKNLALTYKIKITKGGRFYHLIGENQDKGKAVKKTIKIFKKIFNTDIKSIALGDGQNDIEMLEKVDIPIAIKSHNNSYITISNPLLQKSSFTGAKGWNEMVIKNVN